MSGMYELGYCIQVLKDLEPGRNSAATNTANSKLYHFFSYCINSSCKQ